MQTITAISLIKYTSIRYKFFILCYCWNLQWNFSKNLEGNFYLIQIDLFVAESILYFISGILMEIKFLGRKRTILGGMFNTIACLLILALIPVPNLLQLYQCCSYYFLYLQFGNLSCQNYWVGINATFGQRLFFRCQLSCILV